MSTYVRNKGVVVVRDYLRVQVIDVTDTNKSIILSITCTMNVVSIFERIKTKGMEFPKL